MTNVNVRYVIRYGDNQRRVFFSPGNLGYRIALMAESGKIGDKFEIEIEDCTLPENE